MTLVLLAVIAFLALLPSSALAATYSTQELEFYRLINDYREGRGLAPLLLSDAASGAAAKHSLDMGHYSFFSHTTEASDYFPVGSQPWDRMAICGYDYSTTMGENIAAGYPDAESVFSAWKASSGHNANMLNSSFRVIGIGLESIPGSPYQYYWTTDLGGYVDPTAHDPDGSPPPVVDSEPPTVTFLHPTPDEEVSGTVAIEVFAADNASVERVTLYVDGKAGASDSAAPYRFTWDCSNVAVGMHRLEARAQDSAGNLGTATVLVEVVASTTTTTATTTTTRSTTTTTVGPTTSTVPVTTTLPSSTTTTTVAEPSISFPDVPEGHIFYQEISALAANKVVSGCADGLFHPESPVTRAQFAKIIVLSLGVHSEAMEAAVWHFTDVVYTGESYPFDYVEEAWSAGVVGGFPDGTFRPQQPITRVQLALMLTRAGDGRLTVPPPSYAAGFQDVPLYAAEAVRIARYNGILSGKTATTFDPYGLATRGQVAKMVCALSEALAR